MSIISKLNLISDSTHQTLRLSRLNPSIVHSSTLENLLSTLKVTLPTPIPKNFILLEVNFVNLSCPSIQLNYYHIKNLTIKYCKTTKISSKNASSYITQKKLFCASPNYDIDILDIPPYIVELIESFSIPKNSTFKRKNSLFVNFHRLSTRSSFSIRCCYMKPLLENFYIDDEEYESLQSTCTDLLDFLNS